MAACPNCQSYVLDGQLFCRACGFCMDHGFQVSTRTLGLPSTGPQQSASTQPAPRARTNYKARHRFGIPIAGFVLALLVGGLSAAPFMSMNNNNNWSHHSCGQSSQSFLSERSYMGVYLTESYDGSSGAYIDAVLEGSPADQAGLISGDRIVAVNDGSISTISDLVSHLKRTAPGTTITIRVERENESFYTALTTTRRSELNFQARRTQGFLGVGDLDTITIHGETNETANTGVLVGRVIDNSAAQFSGLESGDVILSIDGHSTETPQQLARRVRATSPQQIVPILVWRDGQIINLSASMGER